MNPNLQSILDEFAALEVRLADPATLADPPTYQALSKRYGELTSIASVARELREAYQRRQEAETLLRDADLGDLARADLVELEERIPALEARFEELSLPRDPADDRNVIVEIRAGTGGAEAALFAADLYRLYQRYVERLGFKFEALDSNASDLGGFSRVTFEVSGYGAYGLIKFESGVHRVQRVPATEAAGRIHTSTVTVAVLPEAEDVDVHLDPNELRIDVFRSGGHGGQGVNTTDSAVRVVYRPGTPDEIIVTCQDGRSQIKNKEKALTVLRSRLFERERERSMRERSEARASQVGSGERSEKIRTYNFPQNRVTDHRLEGENKNFPLQQVMEGDLQPITEALLALEKSRKLEARAQQSVQKVAV